MCNKFETLAGFHGTREIHAVSRSLRSFLKCPQLIVAAACAFDIKGN